MQDILVSRRPVVSSWRWILTPAIILLALTTWGASQIQPIGTQGSYPDIQVDGTGNLHLVYGRSGKTYYRMLARGARAFTAEEYAGVGASSDHREQPDVGIDGQGVVHVLGGCSYNTRTSQGWGTSQYPGVSRDHHMAVTANGDVWIVCRGGQLYAVRKRAGQPQFDAGQNIYSDGSTDHVYPDISAGTDGTVHVVFRMMHPNDYDCGYLRYDGQRWGTVEWACKEGRSKVEEGPHLALDRNNVPWASIPEGNLLINHRTGGTWNHDIVMLGSAHTRSEPTIGVDRADNKFVAVWGGEYHVYRAATNKWTSGKLPSTNSDPIGFVDVVADSEGAYMVYEQGQSVNKDVGSGAVDLVVVKVLPDGSVVPASTVTKRPLEADLPFISSRTGGMINFTLTAGQTNAQSGYLLLGSLSGTTPGLPLYGGSRLPLNPDGFSWALFQWMHHTNLNRFTWWTDTAGNGRAYLKIYPNQLDPLVGVKMYFAYVTLPGLDYGSNAVDLLIEP